MNDSVRERKSLRLPGYDYAQGGAYFVTICTWGRTCLFGDVVDGIMRLNDVGRIVAGEWINTAEIRREIELDAYMVMPNHVHGLIVIAGNVDVGAHGRAPLHGGLARPPKSLGSLVAGFKSAATKRINELRNAPGTPVWQRNYYEHVIRDEYDLSRVRDYIVNNPAQWALDRDNPAVWTRTW